MHRRAHGTIKNADNKVGLWSAREGSSAVPISPFLLTLLGLRHILQGPFDEHKKNQRKQEGSSRVVDAIRE